MARLYVANCTKYIQDFLYRLPDKKNQIFQKIIPIGGQVEVREGSVDLLVSIIKQHLHYGLVPVEEVDRTKNFFGLCYSIDKPINIDVIMNAVQHNEEEKERRSHEQRKRLAATLSNTIDDVMATSDSKLQSVEVEFVEQRKGDADTRDKMKEAIQVVKPGSKAAARAAERAAERGYKT
jgi:hypothetical protein